MANLHPRKDRPAILWHGGKWKIAQWVIKHLPPHRRYVEPYGGGASVLLRKAPAAAEIYNDLDRTVVNLFRVLRDRGSALELVRMLELTPFARDEFEIAYEDCECPIERARRTIARSFMGFGSDATAGVYKTGFRRNVTSRGKMPSQEWASYPESLRRVIERMAGVVVENMDAATLMAELDNEETLFYLDPPYLPETRSQKNRRGAGPGYHVYQHEMTTEQHVELLDLVISLKGMVVLSGYASELYDEALGGWRCEERATHADGARPRLEKLWINPAAADRLSHLRLI